MLGNSPEVEDVGQEIFIRFYKALNKFRQDSSIGTYITRIAINVCINEINKSKKMHKRFLRDNNEEIMNNVPETTSELRYEDKKMINDALQKLKPDHRSVIVLRIMEGYSTDETAKILKIPVGTVLSRLARAQEKLKKFLDPFFGAYNETNN